MPKIIGLLCNFVEGGGDSDKLSINQDYVRFVESFGLVTLVDPTDEKVKGCDLLIQIGGSDVNPATYGEYYDQTVSLPNRALERFDFCMVKEYLQAGIPIFNICRSFQFMGIGGGVKITGRLNKHVGDEPTSSWLGQTVHPLCNEDRSVMMMSNSSHHQTIDVLGEDLVPLLWSHDVDEIEEKGKKVHIIGKRRYIEAYKAKSGQHSGVQFHPERHYHEPKKSKKVDQFTRNLIAELLS